MNQKRNPITRMYFIWAVLALSYTSGGYAASDAFYDDVPPLPTSMRCIQWIIDLSRMPNMKEADTKVLERTLGIIDRVDSTALPGVSDSDKIEVVRLATTFTSDLVNAESLCAIMSSLIGLEKEDRAPMAEIVSQYLSREYTFTDGIIGRIDRVSIKDLFNAITAFRREERQEAVQHALSCTQQQQSISYHTAFLRHIASVPREKRLDIKKLPSAPLGRRATMD